MDIKRKEWIIGSIYTGDFLKEVKNGDLVTYVDKEYGNITMVWCDELDRPQKLEKDSSGNYKVITNYGE